MPTCSSLLIVLKSLSIPLGPASVRTRPSTPSSCFLYPGFSDLQIPIPFQNLRARPNTLTAIEYAQHSYLKQYKVFSAYVEGADSISEARFCPTLGFLYLGHKQLAARR